MPGSKGICPCAKCGDDELPLTCHVRGMWICQPCADEDVGYWKEKCGILDKAQQNASQKWLEAADKAIELQEKCAKLEFIAEDRDLQIEWLKERREELESLAYIGEHYFEENTYKYRLEELLDVLWDCRDVIDEFMGDSDIDEDSSKEFMMMQRLNIVLRKAGR